MNLFGIELTKASPMVQLALAAAVIVLGVVARIVLKQVSVAMDAISKRVGRIQLQVEPDDTGAEQAETVRKMVEDVKERMSEFAGSAQTFEKLVASAAASEQETRSDLRAMRIRFDLMAGRFDALEKKLNEISDVPGRVDILEHRADNVEAFLELRHGYIPRFNKVRPVGGT